MHILMPVAYCNGFIARVNRWHDIVIISQVFIDLVYKKTSKTMGNLLYVIAVILIIGWAIGFFGYHAGGIIHVLLVIAIIAILFRVIRSA